MDGSHGYEPRVYYTPTMGYDAGSSVVANSGPDHRHDHEQHHQTTAQLHQQGQQPQWQQPHVPYTHVQYSAGGASTAVPNSPLQAPIFNTPAHQGNYFGDTSAWQQQQQQQPWQQWPAQAYTPGGTAHGAYSPAFNQAPPNDPSGWAGANGYDDSADKFNSNEQRVDLSGALATRRQFRARYTARAGARSGTSAASDRPRVRH